MKKPSAAKPASRRAAKPAAKVRRTAAKAAKAAKPKTAHPAETEEFLKSLREHKQVIEADRADVDLPPGVNYVLVQDGSGDEPQLVERRKSFI